MKLTAAQKEELADRVRDKMVKGGCTCPEILVRIRQDSDDEVIDVEVHHFDGCPWLLRENAPYN